MGKQRSRRYPVLPFAVAVVIAVAIPVATVSFLKGTQSSRTDQGGVEEPSLGNVDEAWATQTESSPSGAGSVSVSASPSVSDSPSPSAASPSPPPSAAPTSAVASRPRTRTHSPAATTSAAPPRQAPAPKPATPSRAPAPYLQVQYKQTSEWDDGYTADFVLYNKGNAYSRTWKITITLPKGVKVNEAWDMSYSISGQTVTFTPTNFEPLAPGGKDWFGFQAYSPSGFVAPTSCTVDGHPCA